MRCAVNKIIGYSGFVLVLFFTGCQGLPDYDKVGYAPPEAFEPDSEYPYYGSFTRVGFIEPEVIHKKLHLYKRRGQFQMLHIVREQPEKAAEYCRELLKETPDDPEFWYTLCIAQCQMDDILGAIRSMGEALHHNLPFERFLAGPRELIQPLAETDAFRKTAAEYGLRLIHGPLLGCVTGSSASFWVRTVEKSSVRVKVSRNKNMNHSVYSETVVSDPEEDYTAVAWVSGLQSSKRYYYDVIIDGESALDSPHPSFRTYPAKGKAAMFQVGFGGGAGYVPWHERMWNVIASHDPVAFFLMGDNVYHDMPEAVHGGHNYTYYRRQSRPEFRHLVSGTAIYAIWDDHDCATNDVFMGPYREKPDWKMDLFHLFRRNWNNPAYGDEEWPGVWFKLSIGDVDFFMLDGRFYRTNPHLEKPTMLGPVQKAWLKDVLLRSKGTFKVIVSPVPWSYGSKGESLDTWNGYREERTEIFDFLADNEIEGVFLLSADRHRSDAWRIERPNGYALYEFESSRLTNEHVHKVMPGSLFGYNEKQSFGLLTFDTTLEDPIVIYQIYSIDDELIHTLEVKKSELVHK